jgi:magnesium-protoporphyrin IX monomethyl ester (oxidative) cyclase
MSKALLINPGFRLGKPLLRDNYIFPFGLGYIASYAENNGHIIDVWDIYGKQTGFEQVKIELSEIDFSAYDVIGITGIVNQYLYIKELAKLIKQYSSIKIVLGGPLASYSWKTILIQTAIDICVIGEGEKTFLDILNGVNLSQIDGIIYKSDEKVIINKERDLIRNIDDIGFPAFHLFDMEFYATHTGMMQIIRPNFKNERTMALITSRGCPYNCKFCSKSVKGTRMKSLDFLFKEIEFYIKEFKIKAIHFVDELLLVNKKRFIEFCHRIKKYGIVWDCQGRINHVDENLLRNMVAANGVCIGFGIESASQKILDAMDKRIKSKDIERILLICQQIQLPVKLQLIFGYPGENWKTLNETISLFKKIRLPGRRFTVITPLPGSILYEEAKLDGFIGKQDSDNMTEEEYLIFLSKSGGLVSPKLFYNRTEFSDNEFYNTLSKVENIIFNNFLKIICVHPFFIIRNWSLYRLYLRNWWIYYRDRIIIFKLPKYLYELIKNPITFLKKFKNY